MIYAEMRWYGIRFHDVYIDFYCSVWTTFASIIIINYVEVFREGTNLMNSREKIETSVRGQGLISLYVG